MANPEIEPTVIRVHRVCGLAELRMVHQLGAVIRDKADYRVIPQTQIGEDTQQVADPLIDKGNIAVVEGFRAAYLIFRQSLYNSAPSADRYNPSRLPP